MGGIGKGEKGGKRRRRGGKEMGGIGKGEKEEE
mgnify:CR=1 FL=1